MTDICCVFFLLFIPFYLGILFNASLGCTLYFLINLFLYCWCQNLNYCGLNLFNKQTNKKHAFGCVNFTFMLLSKSQLFFYVKVTRSFILKIQETKVLLGAKVFPVCTTFFKEMIRLSFIKYIYFIKKNAQ